MGEAKNKTVAVDFDATLTDYTTYKGVEITDDPLPGAQDFIQSLLDGGFDVVIYSHRAVEPEGVGAIIDWLEEHQFPPVREVTAIKPAALAYVDDRAVRFEGDYEAVLKFIEGGAVPWNHK